MRALAVFACSLTLTGCFDVHGRVGDEDAGAPIDSGRFFTDCWAALSGGENGDACSFDDSCGDVLPGCGEPEPGREVACLGGRLQFFTRTCTLAPWERCEDYVADYPHDGFPGAACIEETFGECAETIDPCCRVVVTCRGGAVHEEHDCHDGCVEGPTCEGYAPPPPEFAPCRSTGDCASSESCVPPGVPRACGICAPVPLECDGAADCGEGEVCVRENVPCSCEPVLGALCRPACTTDSCAEGERCGSDGACEPIACDEGWVCPDNTRCSAETGPALAVDAHGCFRIACASDIDCDCGACIDGLCYDGPGTCQPPVP